MLYVGMEGFVCLNLKLASDAFVRLTTHLGHSARAHGVCAFLVLVAIVVVLFLCPQDLSVWAISSLI